MDDHRYAGRPLLRLLDCYVLALIGHLDPGMEAQVAAIVGRNLGGDHDWKTTVRRAAGLPADMDRRIVELWARQPKGVDPMAFMIAVSDESFLPLIHPVD